MYVHDLVILADATRINVILPRLQREVFEAQRQANASLDASRRAFTEAADLADIMVEDATNDDLSRRLDQAKHATNNAIGHRQDAFIALGIVIEKQTEIDALLGIHHEDED